jgi:UDP-2-acetamido-3-amino-2,3-dideoxy-glucuronate N-acetyltransferase
MSNIFHKTAIIDKGAIIGLGTKIWHWTHVCKGAVIGKKCSLGQNVFVGNETLIGDNVKIQNNVSVYDKITLEDHVFCGPSMVFTNVHNPRSAVSRKNEYRETFVRIGATLGANCTIICGATIGKYAFVGAGSVITKNVKDYALVVGVPAVHIGWMSENGKKLKLPIESYNSDMTAECPETGEIYVLRGDKVKKLGNTI